MCQNNTNLAKSWVNFANAEYESDTYEDNFWAFQELSDLVCDEPDHAIDVILMILSIDSSEVVSGKLGAGPIEDLLGVNGPQVVDRVEKISSENIAFSEALKGCWNAGIDPEVWKRIEKAIGDS